MVACVCLCVVVRCNDYCFVLLLFSYVSVVFVCVRPVALHECGCVCVCSVRVELFVLFVCWSVCEWLVVFAPAWPCVVARFVFFLCPLVGLRLFVCVCVFILVVRLFVCEFVRLSIDVVC